MLGRRANAHVLRGPRGVCGGATQSEPRRLPAANAPGALLAYNRALRYGDSRTFRFGRGRVFYELGRNQQAINDFTCAAAYSPAAGDVLAMRGLARLALAKEASPALAKSLREQGEADLRLAHQLDPDDGTVHWALKHRP